MVRVVGAGGIAVLVDSFSETQRPDAVHENLRKEAEFFDKISDYSPAAARRAQRSFAGVLRELACSSSGAGRITSSFVAE